jgi:hypothetical protein
MIRDNRFTTISLKMGTHERIRNEADATGLKMWALVDRMTDDYFNHIGNV